jgi:hypothetical protein
MVCVIIEQNLAVISTTYVEVEMADDTVVKLFENN